MGTKAGWMAAAVFAAGAGFAVDADAHIGIVGVGVAGTNQIVEFTIGHGCAGLDTLELRVEIPGAITSVRALPSEFGDVTVERDEADIVTAITWSRPLEALAERDEFYYRLPVRIRIPNAPFTELPFRAIQTCSSVDGSEVVMSYWTAWGDDEDDHGHAHKHHEGPEPGPAAVLRVVPARVPGWNRYTVPTGVTALGDFFRDARIVWSGTQAFSANAVVAEQIVATEGVEVLDEIAAGAEIWVNY